MSTAQGRKVLWASVDPAGRAADATTAAWGPDIEPAEPLLHSVGCRRLAEIVSDCDIGRAHRASMRRTRSIAEVSSSRVVLRNDHGATETRVNAALLPPSTVMPYRTARCETDHGRQLDERVDQAAVVAVEVLATCFSARCREAEHFHHVDRLRERQQILARGHSFVEVLHQRCGCFASAHAEAA